VTEAGDGEKPEKKAQASVWSRDGEGPHQLVPPGPEPVVEPVPAAPTPQVEQASESVDLVDSEDSEVADESDQSDDSNESDESDETEPAEVADAEKSEEPKSAGPPTQNDVAIGYIIVLGLYFLGYLVNMFACNYSLVSDKMNALAEMLFYFIPALCAAAMLLGGKTFKIVGGLLFLPLAGAAFYGSQYFHCFERFNSNTGPYGPAVDIKDENGWHICHYESSWTTGNMPGTTWTREKDAGPGIRYARKMRLGEPP